ncbi:uncharacterized protein LOC144103815 isoform X1 [Amblyomma americanum]
MEVVLLCLSLAVFCSFSECGLPPEAMPSGGTTCVGSKVCGNPPPRPRPTLRTCMPQCPQGRGRYRTPCGNSCSCRVHINDPHSRLHCVALRDGKPPAGFV